jgi:hypothetical protein
MRVAPFAIALGIGGWYGVFRDSSLAKRGEASADKAALSAPPPAGVTPRTSSTRTATPLTAAAPGSAPAAAPRTPAGAGLD